MQGTSSLDLELAAKLASRKKQRMRALQKSGGVVRTVQQKTSPETRQKEPVSPGEATGSSEKNGSIIRELQQEVESLRTQLAERDSTIADLSSRLTRKPKESVPAQSKPVPKEIPASRGFPMFLLDTLTGVRASSLSRGRWKSLEIYKAPNSGRVAFFDIETLSEIAADNGFNSRTSCIAIPASMIEAYELAEMPRYFVERNGEYYIDIVDFIDDMKDMGTTWWDVVTGSVDNKELLWIQDLLTVAKRRIPKGMPISPEKLVFTGPEVKVKRPVQPTTMVTRKRARKARAQAKVTDIVGDDSN